MGRKEEREKGGKEREEAGEKKGERGREEERKGPTPMLKTWTVRDDRGVRLSRLCLSDIPHLYIILLDSPLCPLKPQSRRGKGLTLPHLPHSLVKPD